MRKGPAFAGSFLLQVVGVGFQVADDLRVTPGVDDNADTRKRAARVGPFGLVHCASLGIRYSVEPPGYVREKLLNPGTWKRSKPLGSNPLPGGRLS